MRHTLISYLVAVFLGIPALQCAKTQSVVGEDVPYVPAAEGSVASPPLLDGTAVTPCDLNGDANIDVSDIQLIIDEVLRIMPALDDLNNDRAINAVDVQVATTAALGLGCWVTTVPAIANIGSSGGTLQVTNSTSELAGVSLSIPPGALNSTVTISATAVPPLLPDNLIPIGAAVDLQPEGLVFNQPALLTLPHSALTPDTFLGPGSGIATQYQVLTTTVGAQTWDQIQPAASDDIHGTLTVPINHFSVYATGLSGLTPTESHGFDASDSDVAPMPNPSCPPCQYN